jgi:putative sigma-54 modulation protein
MNLHLTGHHVEITAAIRDYVTHKLTRINRHFDHVIDVNVIVTVEKLDQRIEANVHLSGKDIHVQASDADMYAAIDGLIDKLDRQVLKHKERFQPRHPQGIKRITRTDQLE